jgi:heme exporter protein D
MHHRSTAMNASGDGTHRRCVETDGAMRHRTLYRLTWLAVAMSLGHHLDHVVRGNAVGWPLTEEVNAFTISLVVYPVIATGLLLYRAGRVGPGFWALVSGGGAVFVGAVHLGPAAAEPPELILGGYRPPVLGWLAFAWLVAFVAVLAVTSVYETRLWARQPRT